jgi:hypothetical protein
MNSMAWASVIILIEIHEFACNLSVSYECLASKVAAKTGG